MREGRGERGRGEREEGRNERGEKEDRRNKIKGEERRGDDRRQLLRGEGGEAPTCDEGDTQADEEEHLQQEVAIVVNYYSCNYGNDSQTKVLDGLHAVKREKGEEGEKGRRVWGVIMREREKEEKEKEGEKKREEEEKEERN